MTTTKIMLTSSRKFLRSGEMKDNNVKVVQNNILESKPETSDGSLLVAGAFGAALIWLILAK